MSQTMSTIPRRSFLAAAACAVAPRSSGRQTAHRADDGIRLALAAYSYRDHLQGQLQPSMTLFDVVDETASLGLAGLELTEYYFPRPLDMDWVLKLKNHCHRRGVEIVGAPMKTEFTHPAGPARDRELEVLRSWLEVAAVLGAPTIRVFAGSPQPGQDTEGAVRCCIETLTLAAAAASQRGVILALENHGGIVAESAPLISIVKAVDSPWCGINLDSGNFRTTDPYDDFDRCAELAVAVQFKP
ncbi:MAG: sugar phosphate isomerase/epimerase, partial [Planctomycetes bacterium]|nr:sugar phosphate isomerase/epimerase [Planctomycetota bacterium]